MSAKYTNITCEGFIKYKLNQNAPSYMILFILGWFLPCFSEKKAKPHKQY